MMLIMVPSLILFWVLLVDLVNAKGVAFNGCGNDLNKPKSLLVTQCESTPCAVERGHTYQFNFDFDSPVNAENLTVSIKAKILGFWIIWPSGPRKICGPDIDCPLVAGKSYTYKSSMTIPSIPFGLSTYVQFLLEDINTGKVIFCSRFPIRVF